MEGVTEIDISMNNRAFTITLPIKDQELIENIVGALRDYVEKGSPIKARQAWFLKKAGLLPVVDYPVLRFL